MIGAMNLKEIATTLAVLGTGALTFTGCDKEKPATEVPDAAAPAATAGEASCAAAEHPGEGHCGDAAAAEGEGDAEGSCGAENEGEGDGEASCGA